MADDSSSPATSSLSTFGVTLVFNVAIFLIFITAFLFLRPKEQNVYQPRSVIDTIPPNERPKKLSRGIFGWAKDLLTRPESEILQDTGLDGYFFLRYLRLVTLISLVGVIILFPILLPVNATGGGSPDGTQQTGFDILSFSNVKNPNRFYAHALLSWVYFGFIIFTLYRELVYYVGVRGAVLSSAAYSGLISSRTILMSTVPEDYLSVEALESLFDGVKHVWISRVQKELAKKVEERDKLANKVENAEAKLLKLAVKRRLKAEKKGDSSIQGDDISAYIPDKKRPTHRLKPIIGKKVDTIEYGQDKIQELNSEILELQRQHQSSPAQNSAFIAFHTQEQAQTAYQVLAHHKALHMAPRHIGIRPDDIIWWNLRLFWWERLIRIVGAAAAITALVIFWSIPVAFVGAISNIYYLIDKLPWLDFLLKLPKVLFGLVSGLLPTVLLAVLMAVLPMFIRLMAKISGSPSKPLVEYYTQNAYFAFQVIQVFLVVTITSGAASVVTQIIQDPTSAMNLLATNLPKASNFYISYFLLQGFSVAGGALLQIVALVLFHVLSTLLDGTPRKAWSRYNVIGSIGWGTVFPIYTNLAVIAITYSIISPLLLAFSAITFGLVYFAYLHNLTFVVGPSDGRGIYYPRSIFQTFTGLYLAEVCLLGLFVVAKAWGPLVLEVIMIAVTVFVHTSLNKAFDPMLFALPKTLIHVPGHHSEKSLTDSFDDKQVIGSKGEVSHQSNPSLDPAVPVGSLNTVGKGNHVEQGFIDNEEPPAGNFFVRYFFPHRYLTPKIIQREFLGPYFHEAPAPLSAQTEFESYMNPAVKSTNPVVWIPRDPWGLSNVEVKNLRSHDVNVYDEGSWFEINEEKKKSKIAWGNIQEVPIWTTPEKY